MGFRRKLYWLVLVLMPLLLLTDCGDLEPDPDTGTETDDTTAPIIEQVTAIASPTSSSTPDYTFSSTESGTITYGGSCYSSTIIANSGNNTIIFNALSDGYYDDCTITVKDSEGNESNTLTIPPFTVDTTVPDTTEPIIEQVTAIASPTSSSTPNYIFASTEAGSITYGGSCYSATIIATIGNNTIVFNALSDGYYYDCTVTVMDSEGNESNTLTIPPFTVDTTVSDITAPTVSSISGNTTEAGGTATFTVKLSSQPTANVTIGVSSSDTSEGTVSPSLLTFTSANWNVNQTVTVTGVNDSLNDGNQSYTVVLASANSSDSSYSGLNTNDVSVTNTDMTLTAVTIVLYETTTPTRDINNNIVYSDNNSASYSDSDLQADGVRIGYRMELTDNGTDYYAETFFDAWDGITLSSLLFPTVSNANVIQDNVTNMSVDSNYPTVTNTSSTTGRLEIWPWNYGAAAQNNIGGDNSKYDFDDTHTGSSSYGSMQVHNLSAAQTVMAWNRHYDSDPDIGFGNNPANTGNNKHPDWTFSSDSSLGTSNWKFQVLFRYYY